MSATDWIALLVIVLIVGGAAVYIIKEKKKGRKCIGCPYGATCASQGKNGCNCSSASNRDKEA